MIALPQFLPGRFRAATLPEHGSAVSQQQAVRQVLTLAPPDFVERGPILAALQTLGERARGGHGSLVVLVGDAGIGKTSTVQRFAAVAASDGFQVLWGSCLNAEGAPPFWPWIEALGDLGEESGAREVVSGSAPDRLLIQAVIERLIGAEHYLSSPNDDQPNMARFRLFATIDALLSRAAQNQPILLVLDDLHAADRTSLHLLAFIARRLLRTPMLILGTSRPTESTQAGQLFGLLDQTALQTIPVEGLDDQSVRRLLVSVMGAEPSRALLRAVIELTEGNPFFVTEIARWLVREQEVVADKRRVPRLTIPESVHAVITLRLDRLSEPMREFLRTAAIFGREVSADVLQSMHSEASKRGLLDTLEEAARAHILETRPGTLGYRFRHELIRQVLYAELPPGARALLHARAVAMLEVRYGADTPDHASELAYHAEKAGDLLDPATLLHYARLAGEHALAAHAYDEAIPHFELALALAKHLPNSVETADIQYGLGRAKAATSPRWHRQEAWEHLRQASESFLEAGEIDRAVAAAASAAIPPEAVTGALDLLVRLQACVLPDSSAVGWLAARTAAAHYFELGNDDAAHKGFARAIASARANNDLALELRILAMQTAVLHFDLQWSGVLEVGRRVIRLARDIDDLHAETYARYRLAFALVYTGRAEEALFEAPRNLVAAEALADDGLLQDALSVNAALAQLRGNWREARQYSDRGLDLASHNLPLLYLRVVLEFETGHPEAGGHYLDLLLNAPKFAGPYSLREAYSAAVIPHLALLGEERGALAASPPALASNPNAQAFMQVGEALAAIRDGNVAAAERAMHALASRKGAIRAPALVTERLLGVLSATTGSLDAAMGYFEEALQFCRYAGYRPELAWSCHDYAQALVARDRTRDRAHAALLLAEAEAIATELGMHPLLVRIAGFRQRHREKLDRQEAALSPRELKVAQLLGTGRTNQEIADVLFISTHTVAAHVARILAKTGCKNRTEAAAFIEREYRLAADG